MNTGLTQVLDDGTNTYTYGLGRISQQQGTTAEYFLGDALGSVRQLTDTAGVVTFAKSYDPYGVVTQSAGSGESAYGFTGEQQSNDMVYLRARYYNVNDGRFLTIDPSRAESNLYLYTKANPVNRVDPSGNYSGCVYDPSSNVSYVETFAKILKSDWLNTYAMAGVSVQCWADIYDGYARNAGDGYDGLGPGKITNKQKETPYGDRIADPDHPDDDRANRGYGILCYIINRFDPEVRRSVPCTICKTKDEMDEIYGNGNYKEEGTHNQTDKWWAVEYMRRRIKLVTDLCVANNCSATDVYIAASLAQDGPLFTTFSLTDWLLVPKNRIDKNDLTLDWYTWFTRDTTNTTNQQLERFEDATAVLEKTWTIPKEVNFDTIHGLRKY